MINAYNRWFYQCLAGFLMFAAVLLMAGSFFGSVSQLRSVDGQLGILEMPISKTLQSHLDNVVDDFGNFGTIEVQAQFGVIVVDNVFAKILETAVMSLLSNLILDLIDQAFGVVLDFISLATDFIISATRNVYNVFSALARKSVIDFNIFGFSASQLLSTVSQIYVAELAALETEQNAQIAAEVTRSAVAVLEADQNIRACAADRLAQQIDTSSADARPDGCNAEDVAALKDSVEELVAETNAIPCIDFTNQGTEFNPRYLYTIQSGCEVEASAQGNQAVAALTANEEAQEAVTERTLDEASDLSKSGECNGLTISDPSDPGTFELLEINSNIAYQQTPKSWWSIGVYAQTSTGQTAAERVADAISAGLTSPSFNVDKVATEVCSAAQETVSTLNEQTAIDNPCGGTATGCENFLSSVISSVIDKVNEVINALKDAIINVIDSFTRFLNVFAFTPFSNLNIGDGIIAEAQEIKNSISEFSVQI